MKHKYDQRFFRTFGNETSGEVVFVTLPFGAGGARGRAGATACTNPDSVTGDRSSGTFIIEEFREGGKGT